ncbi:MAG: guanylate kinase [Propionibacteriaceae bacterium]|nr:guanylate kinase [Propionibacteriaceae bacterium]
MHATSEPSVWIISGPSGVGKGTVCARVSELHPEVHIPVSVTTRPPRPGEINGISYHFITQPQFEELKAAGELLESAQVHGRHYYGTPRSDVTRAVADGRKVLLEIDLQGARQVKRNMPEARLVFLAPPSWEELIRRLKGRGTEDDSAVARRLRTAEAELAAQREADFLLINDRLEDTVQALVSLLGL